MSRAYCTPETQLYEVGGADPPRFCITTTDAWSNAVPCDRERSLHVRIDGKARKVAAGGFHYSDGRVSIELPGEAFGAPGRHTVQFELKKDIVWCVARRAQRFCIALTR